LEVGARRRLRIRLQTRWHFPHTSALAFFVPLINLFHDFIIKGMFVSRKVVSGKPLSNISYVCLLLGKLVNGKHFSVKEKFDLVFRKVFSWKIWMENIFRKLWKNSFRETTFQSFLCLFAIRKVGQQKTLSSQRKIWLGFQESVFLENLGGKHFPEVVKNLKMSYYLLIISNLVLKLLIAIYILFWLFIFQFRLLKFIFYINFGPHFYNCYLFFPYHFVIEIFYLSNLILILLIVTYFIW